MPLEFHGPIHLSTPWFTHMAPTHEYVVDAAWPRRMTLPLMGQGVGAHVPDEAGDRIHTAAVTATWPRRMSMSTI